MMNIEKNKNFDLLEIFLIVNLVKDHLIHQDQVCRLKLHPNQAKIWL